MTMVELPASRYAPGSTTIANMNADYDTYALSYKNSLWEFVLVTERPGGICVAISSSAEVEVLELLGPYLKVAVTLREEGDPDTELVEEDAFTLIDLSRDKFRRLRGLVEFDILFESTIPVCIESRSPFEPSLYMCIPNHFSLLFMFMLYCVCMHVSHCCI